MLPEGQACWAERKGEGCECGGRRGGDGRHMCAGWADLGRSAFGSRRRSSSNLRQPRAVPLPEMVSTKLGTRSSRRGEGWLDSALTRQRTSQVTGLNLSYQSMLAREKIFVGKTWETTGRSCIE
jgi:hypothetical protein